ncbi:Tripartite tricarboxylate transporter TctB family protein [Poseidonocella pacifica]|uniref:Tripartite tricarboxylate transporter TctB family protein n=1 Tax=Poseidonocella pacifica TaxID=871651 RepID=A0A1I0YTW1_9RHOB|nr:tripartite tricarboxylate transporter TctB family protein [Poseidonocella pacifica]SFB15563.1 Tripartite tricarboxylate transporter TctB family protein [Poseidonocella pacifica]
MTVRTAELIMAIALLLASLGLMANIYFGDLNIGWVPGRGPGAGMWPFWLSLGMALSSVATLFRWVTGATPESRNTEPFVAPETIFLVSVSAISILVLLLMMTFIGTYFALMIFMFFFVRVLGKHGWVATMGMVIGTPVFVYLLFEVALTKYLPKGLPVFEEMFLAVDNLRYALFY